MKIYCRGWSRFVKIHTLFNEELSHENVMYYENDMYGSYFNKITICPSTTSDEVNLAFGGTINNSNYYFNIEFSLSEILPYIGKSIKHLQFNQILDSTNDSNEVFHYENLPKDKSEEDKEIECAWCYASESSVKKMFNDNTDVYICNDCIASAATKLLVDD